MKNHLTKSDLIHLLRCCTDHMIANRDRIGELDAAIGDGDLGVTILLGFNAVKKVLEDTADYDIQTIMNKVAVEISENASSTFGILMYSMFSKAGNAIAGHDTITPQDGAIMLQAAIDGVMKKGKATLGDKTVLDAMVPATEAYKVSAAEGKSLYDCLQAAIRAGTWGAEQTIEMRSKAGRSSFFSERSAGVMDPGAYAFVIFMQGIDEFFKSDPSR